jgi:hypothetical protein
MADITLLSRLVDGLQRQVNISDNTLVTTSIKVGGGVSNTELTKTILDLLVTLQNGSDISASVHHHDGRYFTETEISSTSGTTGSDRVGDDNTYTNFTPAATTVKGALSGIDTALGALVTDSKDLKVSANDTTPGFLEDKIVSANSMLTIATLNDGGNEDLQLTIVNSAIDHGVLAGLADDDHTQYHNDTRGDARYYQKSEFVTTATAGAPVKLDGAGKIAAAQLPSAVMTYEGVWNANTNSPSLADGVGDTGMVYRVSTAGTQNLGSGSITFDVGDYVIYNGTVWEKSDTTDAVASVNGATGVVTVNAINQLTGDVTATAASGSESKATTVAAIQGTTVSGTTGTGNVVFSASPTISGTLSAATVTASGNITGANLSGTNTGDQTITLTGDVTGSGTGSFATTIANNAITSTKIATSVAGSGLTGGGGSALSVLHAPKGQTVAIAGESMAANTSFLVRWARTGETAGRVYKADNDATTNQNFYAWGIALKTSAVSAGDNVDVVFEGTFTLGSSDTPFASGDVGKPVYLTTAGGFSITPPSSTNTAVWRVGVVQETDKIWVGDKQLNGIN